MFNLRQALDTSSSVTSPRDFQEYLDIISKLYAFARLMLRSTTNLGSEGDSQLSRQQLSLEASQWLTIALEALESKSVPESRRPGHDLPYNGLKLRMIKALSSACFAVAQDKLDADSELMRHRGERAFDEALVSGNLFVSRL